MLIIIANMTPKKKGFSYKWCGDSALTNGGTDSVEKIYRGERAVGGAL